MGRRDYERTQTGCTLGINQQLEKSSFEECADARNMWAPNGKLEQRPGYVGLYSAPTAYLSNDGVDNNSVLTSPTILIESPLGTFTTTAFLGGLLAGERWYIGYSGYIIPPTQAAVLSVPVNVVNLNDMVACVEYWNGSSWVVVNATETSLTGLVSKHLSVVNDGRFNFPFPSDIAQTTVAGLTNYFFRFTMQSVNGSTALSAGTHIDLPSQPGYEGASPREPEYIYKAQFASTLRYLVVLADYNSTTFTLFYWNTASLRGSVNGADAVLDTVNAPIPFTIEPATFATVAQFDTALMGYNHKVIAFTSNPTTSDSVNGLEAQVESRDFAVGPNALFDAAFISQLGAFPKANYVTFFAGRLWFSGIDGQPYTSRWGAAAPFFKVLPTISAEDLISSDDGSPITGQSPLGEQLVIFKENSIWIMVDSGTNAFGLSSFTPIRRVSGIGCVSNASIQQVRGELIFLSKNGLYAFNGVTARKISEVKREGEIVDRLKDFWPTITPGRTQFATGIDYQKRNTYLLALTVDGADHNNRVLVWDYEHDSFWLWDNFDVQSWVLDTSDTLLFNDGYGCIYKFDVGNQDNGAAISSYVETQRWGFDDRMTQTVREVEIAGTTLSQSVGVEILANGASTGQLGNTVGTVTFTDPTEKAFDVAVFDVDSLTLERARKHHISTRQTCNYWQIRLTHSVKGAPFSMSSIDVGYVSLGAR